MKTHIVNIGYGRSLFDEENEERRRLAFCARETACVHMIVFSLRSHGLKRQQVHDSFILYPTNSRSRFSMFYDAMRIGMSVLKKRSSQESWCITSQDPLATGVVGWVLRLLTRVPFVLQEHGDIFSGTYWKNESFSHMVWYWVGRFLIRRGDRVRAVSLRVKEHLIELGVPPEKIVVLPVYTDIQKFETHSTRLFSSALCTILSVARFVPQKNLSLLLRSFSRVAQKNAAARLVLVGAGPLQTVIEGELEALGIREKTLLLPWSPDVPGLMQCADIYALSSNYEGWGRVLIEAMASGLPVVTTEVGCVGEALLHGQHGLVVPVGDEEAFTHALMDLVGDVIKRERLATPPLGEKRPLFSNPESYAKSWAEILCLDKKPFS